MSMSTLLKVAGGVGVVGLGASIWMERKVQNMYRQQGFYQKSVLLLQNYTPAAQFLGKPIFSGRVYVGDKALLNVEDYTAKLVVPVVGSIDEGLLYIQASRENKETEWTIDQLDLEIKSSQQKWTFYQRGINEAPAVERENQVSSTFLDKSQS
ncbi:cytochrome c oxidase assembly protein 1-like protein [Elysia marginata]|uniref:Cytochrome c oxidase assembly protein 1-like protein n=1 Tax=Elysia marginata TaxID=1093978 RepID=A0AAV4GGC4_9GAST|nr:cytochrome c oxidase assembly protein 1-like protein [Elysia marginata]